MSTNVFSLQYHSLLRQFHTELGSIIVLDHLHGFEMDVVNQRLEDVVSKPSCPSRFETLTLGVVPLQDLLFAGFAST